jgi:hypothetical protein
MSAGESFEIDGSLAPDGPPRVGRGRPRSARTLVINVRLTEDVYDAYCRSALRSRVPVRQVLRRVLSRYAPPDR